MRGIPAVSLIGGRAIADSDRQKWSSGDGGVRYIPYIPYGIWIRPNVFIESLWLARSPGRQVALARWPYLVVTSNLPWSQV